MTRKVTDDEHVQWLGRMLQYDPEAFHAWREAHGITGDRWVDAFSDYLWGQCRLCGSRSWTDQREPDEYGAARVCDDCGAVIAVIHGDLLVKWGAAAATGDWG